MRTGIQYNRCDGQYYVSSLHSDAACQRHTGVPRTLVATLMPKVWIGFQLRAQARSSDCHPGQEWSQCAKFHNLPVRLCSVWKLIQTSSLQAAWQCHQMYICLTVGGQPGWSLSSCLSLFYFPFCRLDNSSHLELADKENMYRNGHFLVCQSKKKIKTRLTVLKTAISILLYSSYSNPTIILPCLH